jgi:hypothetical protein
MNAEPQRTQKKRGVIMRRTLVLVVAFFTHAAAAQDKKFIEFGWDEPDTAFMRAHVAEMEKTPFDGCVFHVNYLKDGKPTGTFLWECWSKRTFTEAELQPALDDLKATHFTRFTENFLRFNTVPGDVDWFDDFSAVLANAKLAAKIAKEGNCRGILFDIEQYNSPLFDYRKQRDAKSKSWDQYAAQVRARGREVIKAFQDGYPGLTVFLTFGYSLPHAQSAGKPAKLPDCSYGLLAPLLDGMLDAAEGSTVFVDGYELSYAYKTAAEFDKARDVVRTAVLPLCGNREAYAKRFTLGPGLWMDDDWRKKGWDDQDVSKNYFTPDAFEKATREALRVSDKYVWIYTEQPRWWTASGKPEKLPESYAEALKKAEN